MNFVQNEHELLAFIFSPPPDTSWRDNFVAGLSPQQLVLHTEWLEAGRPTPYPLMDAWHEYAEQLK